MNKRIISVLFAVLFLTFIGVMDYPFIAQLINERDQTAVTVDYQNLADGMETTEIEQYLSDAVEYNQLLATGLSGNLEVPFAVPGKMDPAYAGMLNMDKEGMMAIVDIPKLKVTVPIYHSASDEAMDKGAGHMEGSSLPVGGENTHSCIIAHRGIPTQKLFTNLDEMENGDIFYIEVLDKILAYQVYHVEIVTPDMIEPLKIQPGKDIVTLITCTPYGVNSHRLYIHASRIPLEQIEEQVSIETEGLIFWKSYWWLVLTVVLLVWVTSLLYWFNRSPKPKAEKGENSEKV